MPITASTIQSILSTDNPNEGRVKINENFESLLSDISNINSTGSNITGLTWSELASTILSNGLTEGMLYKITDFRTCYDQPDFDYNGAPITSGNYKEGPVEPIIVLATSNNTISSSAYQPAYPKDSIQYDWYWGVTEVTNGAAFGRITERIDQFNNRTDYDHRNILFKRYKLFTIRADQPLNGTVQLLEDGTVNGVGTSFNNLTVGDVISIPSTNPSFYEIISITDDTTMNVTGDTITSVGVGQEFYKAIEETNDSNGCFSFKRMNVKTNAFNEYTTFGNALEINYAKNNYVGNYANNYTNVGSGVFLLSNNVFLEGQYESNKFGDHCFNNTFGTDNQNNVWGDYCYENVSTNDIDGNIIGHYFYGNLLNVNFVENIIGNEFYNNKLLAENSDDFGNNQIGDYFHDNVVYSYFYRNVIDSYFYNNTIGDFGNLTQFSFRQNKIGYGFYDNTISQDFSNNSISGIFHDNVIFGYFDGNSIKNNFFENTIRSDSFASNTIGLYFYQNKTHEGFIQNNIGNDFNNNTISNNFESNTIGNSFQSNTPSNLILFGWNDLSNVSTRAYTTFYNSLGGNGGVGGKILGKEFVMRITSTSQYFKIMFTQWSQNGLGGGFQYIRTEIDSAGNVIGNTIMFTKTNYGSEVDYIAPGVVEITRGSGGGAIYNQVSEGGYSNSVSPIDTEWNSIYTEPDNGKNFAYNKIGNDCRYNIIGNDFGYGGSTQQGNVINDSFHENTIGKFMYNNVIGNYFAVNTIGDNFESNSIKNYFIGNTIGDRFENNQIGDYFGQNGGTLQNTIFNDFKYNKIGNYFGNEFNFPTVSGGTGANGGNTINDGFQFNQIGDNCIYCMFDLGFDNNQIGNDFWFNFFGINNSNNTIGNLFVGNVGIIGFPGPIGDNFAGNTIKNYAGFNKIGSDFVNNEIGNYFGNGGTSNYIAPGFTGNKIGNFFGDDGSATAGQNSINVSFNENEIGDFFYNNTIYIFAGEGQFYSNKIGNNCYSNVISGYTYYNEISHNFHDNILSDEFRSNKINSNFYSNNIGRNFNNNIVQSDVVNSTDFTLYIGNISTYTLSTSLGGTDGVYNGLTGTTNGSGIDASFNVVVSGGAVLSVALNNAGQYYAASDIFTIDGSLIGGVTITDNVIININTVTQPSVYGNYNCTIFKRQDGDNKLSYYDNSNVLNIKDINQ